MRRKKGRGKNRKALKRSAIMSTGNISPHLLIGKEKRTVVQVYVPTVRTFYDNLLPPLIPPERKD